MDLDGRHPATQSVAKYFSYDHLSGEAALASMMCSNLAEYMLNSLTDSPELTVGLRKLLEAKDCFVRASLDI